ncbi:MAG TPA: putative glycoside hydrolase [Gaiellaceae bacterium]|nr:putative glycoside hydrolase [Gaiellaceae bacterium]
MLFPPVDPNERFRERRAAARRRKRLRRGVAVSAILAAMALLSVGAQFVSTSSSPSATVETVGTASSGATPPAGTRALPVEIRGVHVTMGLASLPGKLDEYLDLEHDGLTALELDVKDETGQVGFTSAGMPLAMKVGAARDYYSAREAARLAHDRDIYLIGRVVVFEDPILAKARRDLAIQWPDGSVWRDSAGLGWTNPYDRRVWDYNVDVAVAAARAGFDEIMFDYVRFPSDGDVDSAVYRNRDGLSKHDAIPAFLRYAASRLERHDVRISAAVFGLSASRDLGIGQLPGRMAPHLDGVYAMTYPSLFGPGELGIADPSAAPGETVARALRRFAIRLRGTEVLVVPWVQDFSFTTPFELEEVRAQIDAARRAGAKGFLLWNAEGVYTEGALAPP